ncbi:unnamed protein product [Nesidiocoris tenuis]|uniref:Uncharacterized protein n=1 Tax=Nesidiocoris tenuis TaxID=355587 RepID=A0A6H5H9S5_9HEMI|nr:unnamed protein product [Nesidiocoris tenuis]
MENDFNSTLYEKGRFPSKREISLDVETLIQSLYFRFESFLESPSGRSAPFESVGSFSPLRPIPLLCKLLFTIPTTTDAAESAIYTKP